VNKRKGSPNPSPADKRAVILRDGGACRITLPNCTGAAETAHHRANRGAGGSRVLNAPQNLLAACTRCNGDAETADAETRAELIRRGVRVEKAATNAATLTRAANTPVLYPDGWFLLIDASTREPWKDTQ
jgi:5-methylcytosine-specific restriction endonuclease McrA